MKTIYLTASMLMIFAGVAMAQNSAKAIKTNEKRYVPEPYIADSLPLYNTILTLDSTYFDTYNHCNLEKMALLMSDSLEFYHDRGGLSTSKKEVIAGIEKNICGKVTRTLVPGSVEVYPIHNFGAIEIGYHYFFNNAEPNLVPKKSKFIIIWQFKNNNWKITRVVSLH